MKPMNSVKKLYLKLKNINSIHPVSKVFGSERGLPIDRFYIEKFLNENRSLIYGDVLEVGGNEYTKKFGGDNVTMSSILHINKNSNADFVGNLETGTGVPKNRFDCFICTQTLLCIYDVRSAVKNALKLLKSDGTILLTLPGITKISRFDYHRWGQFWSFTDQSVFALFSEYLPPEKIFINTFGNVKSASAFLYGLAENDLRRKDLDYHDPDYQVIISAIIQK